MFNKPELDTVFEGRDGDGVPELGEVTQDPLELLTRQLQVGDVMIRTSRHKK